MNILVARESGGWGDVLCTLFAVRGLRRKYPTAHISYFCAPSFRPTLERFPDVDRVLVMGYDDATPARRVRGGRRRMNEPFSADLYGLSESYDLVVDLWCPAQRDEQAGVDRSRIESFCAAAGVPVPPVPALPITEDERAYARRLIADLAGRPETPVVLVQLHGSRIAKTWPRWHIETLGRALAGHGVRAVSVHLDGPPVPGIPSVRGLGHLQIAALAAEVNCVVAPDSALWHLAAFVGTPAVGLFGPTAGAQYQTHYPLGRVIQGRPAATLTPCARPCNFRRENGFRSSTAHCLEHGDCMLAIEPRAVVDAVLSAIHFPIPH